MDVIPLDALLVKGSHGRRPTNPEEWPVLITARPKASPHPVISATEVFEVLCAAVGGNA